MWRTFCTIFFVMSIFTVACYTASADSNVYDSKTLLVKLPTTTVNFYSNNDSFYGFGQLEFLFQDTQPSGRARALSQTGSWHVLYIQNGQSVEDVYSKLQQTDGILDINYNYYVSQFDMDTLPKPVQTAASQTDVWSASKSGLPDARAYLKDFGWESGGSENVVVAVIDSGVDYNHEDLAQNIWTNPGEIPNNGKDDDGNGYIDDIRGWDFGDKDKDPMDMSPISHGTHCAGIIAAANNNVGICGVAYNTKIMPIKILANNGNIILSDLILGMEYAAKNGADVVSMSVGVALTNPLDNVVTVLKNMIDKYADKVIFVASAGNAEAVTGENGAGWPNQSISGVYSGNYLITYPAALTNVVGVMSYNGFNNNGDYKSSFSRWDPNPNDSVEYELIAPGNDILSTIKGSAYGSMSGTSMAAPYVSGCYALLMAKYKGRNDFTATQIRQLLIDTADSMRGITLNQKTYMFSAVNINSAITYKWPLQVKLENKVIEYTGKPAATAAQTQISGLDIKYRYTNDKDVEVDSAVSCGKYTVTAQIDDLYYDGQAVGSLCVEPKGDLNGDYTIDKQDIINFKQLQLEYKRTNVYNQKADLNNDGVIDFKDTAILMWYANR